MMKLFIAIIAASVHAIEILDKTNFMPILENDSDYDESS